MLTINLDYKYIFTVMQVLGTGIDEYGEKANRNIKHVSVC